MKFGGKFTVVLFEEHLHVSLYTILFEGEGQNEFEKFLTTFMNDETHIQALWKIVAWIDKIKEVGALERYFRPESRMSDGVGAIPIDSSLLRLYCLRVTDGTIIIGNGGVKPKGCRTYNAIPNLNEKVETLAGLDKKIKERIRSGEIWVHGNRLLGNLEF